MVMIMSDPIGLFFSLFLFWCDSGLDYMLRLGLTMNGFFCPCTPALPGLTWPSRIFFVENI